MAKKPKDTKTKTKKKAKSAPAIKAEVMVVGDEASGIAEVQLDPNVAPELSDDACAEKFVGGVFGRLVFVRGKGWYAYDGRRWLEDTKAAQHLARGALRLIAADAGSEPTARSIASKVKRDAVLALAMADPRLTVDPEVFDTDKMLLNCPGGTWDLRTNTMRPHNAADMITKITRVDPVEGPTPDFDKFMERTFRLPSEVTGDEAAKALESAELAAGVLRMLGYSITGLTKEQLMFLMHGDGGNGKGSLIRIVIYLLGDYANAAQARVFQLKRNDDHPTSLARLQGYRFVSSQEPGSGAAWDEALIKQLTGEDVVVARKMGQDEVAFYPQLKLWFATNQKPAIRNLDQSMRRRIVVVPFKAKLEEGEVDAHLREKLEAEGSAILYRLMEACAEYQSIGLAKPKAVTDATEQYFDEEDFMARFFEECCDRAETVEQKQDKDFWVRATDLHDMYAYYSHHRKTTSFGPRRLTQLWQNRRDLTYSQALGDDRNICGFRYLRLKTPRWKFEDVM